MESNESSGGGCLGCAGFLITVLIIWAFFFGITVDGNHYSIGCSFNKGVEVEQVGRSQRGL